MEKSSCNVSIQPVASERLLRIKGNQRLTALGFVNVPSFYVSNNELCDITITELGR